MLVAQFCIRQGDCSYEQLFLVKSYLYLSQQRFL